MKEFQAFSLLLTENCNLACKYCYEAVSSGHRDVRMTSEVAVETVDWMFRQTVTGNHISVTMFGGEPTLMPDIIDVICNRGKELSKRTGIKFDVNMITNATVMNEKLYGILEKHLDIWTSTQLSVDGPWDIQDEYRVTKGGKGTFATIEKNHPYWRKLYGTKLTVHGVLNQKSIPRLFESYMYFKDIWDEHALWFLPAKSDLYTDVEVGMYDREMGKIYDYILDKVKSDKSIREVSLYAPMDRSLKAGGMDKPCGAGEGYCTVTAVGEVWPCHHMYFIDEERNLKMGDIWNGVDPDRKRVWDEYDNSDMIGCEDCDHGNCYRCPAENYEKNGSPFVQDRGEHCKFMLIDYKYQKMMRGELIGMGLIKDSGNGGNGGNRDCVGKQGECDIYTSVGECKFDRDIVDTEQSSYHTVNVPKDTRETPVIEGDCCGGENCGEGGCGGGCDDKNTNDAPQEWTGKGDVVVDIVSEPEHPNAIIKSILSDVMEVLAKYHNKL